MFEKIKEEIEFIRIYYLHITNYYNYDDLKRNCFEILLYINNTNTISDNKKNFYKILFLALMTILLVYGNMTQYQGGIFNV